MLDRGAATWWHCWGLRGGSPAWFAGVESALHGDREQVQLPEAEALARIGDAPATFVDLDEDGEAVGIRVGPESRSRVPGLWWLEVGAPDATPATSTLIAFADHGVVPGALRRGLPQGDPPVAREDQVGAVRWYPVSGEVDQIYVAPAVRRRRVATELMLAAGMLQAVRRGPRLWGDGQRTDLGESWVQTQPWGRQAAPRTHVAPPMTPPTTPGGPQ